MFHGEGTFTSMGKKGNLNVLRGFNDLIIIMHGLIRVV